MQRAFGRRFSSPMFTARGVDARAQACEACGCKANGFAREARRAGRKANRVAPGVLSLRARFRGLRSQGVEGRAWAGYTGVAIPIDPSHANVAKAAAGRQPRSNEVTPGASR